MMEAVRRLAAPLDPALAACTPVPPAAPGVCPSCHAGCRPGSRRCPTCVRTAAQVTYPAPAVVPVSLFRSGDDLWFLLRRYKDGRDAAVRRECRRRLSRLLASFLRLHAGCIAPDCPHWLVTTVPPTHARAERRPLERVVRRSPWLRRRYVRSLEAARPPEHNEASDAAFRVIADVAGRDLIIVDDTYTTGASVHSAASALQLAGARVVGVVVLGRVVNPAVPVERALWGQARRRPFRMADCCLCTTARQSPAGGARGAGGGRGTPRQRGRPG